MRTTMREERVRKKLMSLRVCAVECNGRGRKRKYRRKGSRAPSVNSQTGQKRERGERNCDVRDTGL